MREISDTEAMFGAEFEAMAARLLGEGDGVLSGCKPTKGSGDSVDVASGDVSADGSEVAVAAANVTLAARNTYARFDLVTIDSLGSVLTTSGAQETAPDLPANEVLVAVVRVPADGDGPITVKDARSETGLTMTSEMLASLLDMTGGDGGTAEIESVTPASKMQIPRRTTDPTFSSSFDQSGRMWYRTDLEALKYEYENGQQEIPLFSPDKCKNPIVRIAQSDGTIKAIEATDPSSAAFNEWRIGTGTKGTLAFHDTALDTTASLRKGMIDDFEDNDIAEYSGETGGFTTQGTTTFGGSYALESSIGTTTTSKHIASSSGLDRYPQAGDTFEFHARWDNAYAEVGGEFAIQGSQGSDSYRVFTSHANQTMYLRRINSDGSQTKLGSASVSIATGEWHRYEVEWGEGGSLVFTLFDSAGTQLGQVSAVDATYTEGGFGWHRYQQNGTGTGWMDSAEITATTSGTGVVDDYEDGDMGEYVLTGTSDSAGIVTSPTYEGSYATHIGISGTNNAEYWSNSGLPRYPQQGDTFQFRWQWDDGTQSHPAFDFATQSESGGNNLYRVSSDAHQAETGDSEFTLVKVSGGSATVVATSSTFEMESHDNTWLRVVIDWGSDGTITATMYDSGGTQLVQISATDTEFSGGGIGLKHNDSGNSSATVNTYWDMAEITASDDATSTGIVDDFEDGDIAEYIGDTGGYGVNTNAPVKSGSYSLKKTTSGGASIGSESGLDRYPEAGDTFQGWVYTSSDTSNGACDMNFALDIAADGTINRRYGVNVKPGTDDMTLFKNNSSGFTKIAQATVTLQWGVWYRMHVQWGAGGGITYTLYDESGSQVGQISGTDTEFTSGGFGYTTWNNGTALDAFEII